MTQKLTKAFTLVELSIVIVIIGLIIAGVTAGKGLVRQAQLRSITTDITKYTAAYNAFKIQYNAVPGDMKNASSYWTTTNGNGNGYVDSPENFSTWKHLELSKLIAGSYTGAIASGGYAVPGINVPKGAFNNSGYQIISQYAAGAIYGRGKTENGIRFGRSGTAYPAHMNAGVISPGNAYMIDQKSDDGLASRGNIIAAASNFLGSNGICVTGPYTGAAGSSNYIMTDTSDSSCVMQFWIGK